MGTDNPMDIKITAKVNANFDPLIKATPKGMDKLFSLVFAKRQANNARHVALTAAQTEKEYEQILSGQAEFRDGKFIALQHPKQIDDLNLLEIEERQSTENLTGNLKVTAETLKDIPDEKISDREVDDDFFMRWRREAKVIGNKDLQTIWGRLLAEEIAEPDSISFRTLDIIKNISNKEAICFRKAGKFVALNKFLLCSLKNNQLPDALTLDDLLMLHSAGLLSVPSSEFVLTLRTQNESDDTQGFSFSLTFKNILLLLNANVHPINVPGIPLSDTGRQILGICDTEILEDEDFKYIINLIDKHMMTKITSAKAFRTDLKDQEQWRQLFAWVYTA